NQPLAARCALPRRYIASEAPAVHLAPGGVGGWFEGRLATLGTLGLIRHLGRASPRLRLSPTRRSIRQAPRRRRSLSPWVHRPVHLKVPACQVRPRDRQEEACDAADGLPEPGGSVRESSLPHEGSPLDVRHLALGELGGQSDGIDRKSTRLNSSHLGISYAVFC